MIGRLSANVALPRLSREKTMPTGQKGKKLFSLHIMIIMI